LLKIPYIESHPDDTPTNEINQCQFTVVIPLLDEEGSLPELKQRLERTLDRMSHERDYEVLFVDDGSTDKSFSILKEFHESDSRFKIIKFRTNFGKSAALNAGFALAKGKIVYTMDADLQDDPDELPRLLEELEKGYDLVSGWKKKRHDPVSKTLPSKFFNWVTSKFAGIRLHDFNCGLKIYRADVIKALDVYGEMHRYLPAIANIMGFRVTEMVVTHHARKHGKSKFGMSRFLKGFLDLLTVMVTTKYVKRPLHFFGTVGSVFAIVGLLIDSWLIIEWLLGYTYLSDRPLFVFGIALIIVGIQFITFGLLGELIIKNTDKYKGDFHIQEYYL
jgi:glycosyltransferase involved in cell wall biosynthesis